MGGFVYLYRRSYGPVFLYYLLFSCGITGYRIYPF